MTTTATPLPEDWKSFNGHDYLVVLVYKSWDDASTFCESRNSYLAEVVADAEAEFMVHLLYEYKETNSFWFGATDRDKKGVLYTSTASNRYQRNTGGIASQMITLKKITKCQQY